MTVAQLVRSRALFELRDHALRLGMVVTARRLELMILEVTR